MRVLAIDFGEVRIGLAISDPAGKMAIPLMTLHRVNDQDAIGQIGQVVAREGVQRLVIGEPRNMDGSVGESAIRVRSFSRKLMAEIPLPCDLVDETLTTVEAVERLRDAGINPRQNPEKIDAVAAQILLEQFLLSQPKPNDV